MGDSRYLPYDQIAGDDAGDEPVDTGPYVRPTHPRRTGTVVAFGLALVVLAATRPLVAFGVLVAAVVLCRVVATSSDAFHDRRERRGARRSDGPLAALLLPWHAVVGALGALPAVLVGACVGVVVVFAGYWLFGDGRIVLMPLDDVESRSVGGRNAPVVFCAVLAVAMLLATLATWFGPAGRTAREGARTVLRYVAPGRLGAAVAVAAFLIAAWVLAAPLLEEPPVVDWWPMSGPPPVA
jgi:hypothetical protein